MKKIITFALIAVMATTAYARRYYATYELSLVAVESPTDSIVGGSLSHGPFHYEDSLISIVWVLSDFKHYVFNLTNKTRSSIKIHWDEIGYIDINQRAGRMIHSGVPFADRNKEQAPTVIPRRASVTDHLVPANRLEFVQGTGVVTHFFFNRYYKSFAELNDIAPQYVGREMSILLPLEIGGKIYEYLFIFRVEKYTGYE